MPEPVQLTRSELYDVVWSAPLQKVASRFGVSDVGLAKLCDRYGVPRPPQGFWARSPESRASHEVPSLPEASSEEVWIHPSPPPRSEPKTEMPTVRVEAEPKDPHKLVRRTRTALVKAKDDERGVVLASGNRSLNVEVTRAAVPRALALIDALVKELEARGHCVSVGGEFKAKTVAEVGDRKIAFSLKEALLQSEHQPTAEEKLREERHGWSSYRRFD